MYRSEYLHQNIDKLIPDAELFPICVPSYNRPDATIFKYIFNIPIWLFIRREQEELYSQYKDKCKIVLLDNVYDIGTTRAAIVQYMWNSGYKNIFMLDDDIYFLSYRAPGYTRSGKYIMATPINEKGKTDWIVNFKPFKMWQWMIYHSSPKVAISGAGRLFDWWNIRYEGQAYHYNSGSIIQCVHLNLQLLMENNIQYASNSIEGAEDYALQYKVMREGLYTVIYKDLTYDSAHLNDKKGGNYTEDITAKYNRYIELFMDNLVEPSDSDKVATKIAKSGIPSIRFRWNKWKSEEKMDYTVDDIQKEVTVWQDQHQKSL